MPRYTFQCPDCDAYFHEFYYPMAVMGTSAVRCAACGSGSIQRIYHKFPTVFTDTNFEPFWDSSFGKQINTRGEYDAHKAELAAQGIVVGEDREGSRSMPEQKQHDFIGKYGPKAASAVRAKWQREHPEAIGRKKEG